VGTRIYRALTDDAAVRRYPSDELRRFTGDVLARVGLSPPDAASGASILLDADLAGVDTHGIVNLASHPHYVKGLRSGEVAASPEVVVLRDAPAGAAWDSGRGFGPVVAHSAMEAAIAKAQSTGIGMVTVRRGLHFGANGYFAEMAARQGLMAMVTANTPVAAFAPGTLKPVVGTNPFAFAAPVGGGPPLVVDIAMTAASGSKVIAARLAGTNIPEGWVVDANGDPTTDPAASQGGGGLELLGGRVAGHKGYGLALMVDALGILAGNASGVRQQSSEWTQGQWFAAWRVDLFVDLDDFLTDMHGLADYIHGVPAKPGATVLLPGERRAATRARRAAHGIPLADSLVAELRQLGSETGVRFPEAVR
jgi:LDH2 family malate/lactate/ureidoglycolate dehydrogenase